MPILTNSNYCSDGNKQTNKKKKQLQNNTVERFVFFDIHANFGPSQLLLRWKQTNKQKKGNFQITLLNDLFFSIFIPILASQKRHQRFVFFLIFVPNPFGERCCCCSLRHFIATNVFALNVCFCSKAFLLLLKKERFTCADKTFFYLVLGTRGLDKQIKNIFFR